MRARSSLSLGISAICASCFVGSTQAMRPKAEEQRDTSNPRYPGMSEDQRPRRARECGMRHRQHPRAGLVAPVSSEARGGWHAAVLPRRDAVFRGGYLGLARGGRGLAERRRRSRLHLVRLSRDQWRSAVTGGNSSESRNWRLRYSSAKRRRSRSTLSRVLLLPVWAAWCRAKFLSA